MQSMSVCMLSTVWAGTGASPVSCGGVTVFLPTLSPSMIPTFLKEK